MDRKTRTHRHSRLIRSLTVLLTLSLAALLAPWATHAGQDQVYTGTNQGATSIRLAVTDFKPLATDAQSGTLKQVFDKTLFSDLQNAGIFDVVSKSMIPAGTPGAPSEMHAEN